MPNPEPTPRQLENARRENAEDRAFGLRDKYHIERIGGTPHKHDDCFYFVLDLDHDVHARPALQAYVTSCKAEYPALANDLLRVMGSVPPPSPASTEAELARALELKFIREWGYMRRVLLAMEPITWMRFVEGPWYATGDFDELAFFRSLRDERNEATKVDGP